MLRGVVDRYRRFALLGVLYVVQGLPFGFQTQALGAYLREHDVSLTNIGFATALSTPWLLKIFWAPFVDRHFSARFGRRKSWIVPMQALLALTQIAAAFAPAEGDVTLLLVLVFLMNLFAATMDIAVDGLAVDMLAGNELGTGNAIQVVGYKIGMLTGGGLLVWASAEIGWLGLFLAMGAITLFALGITIISREPSLTRDRPVPTSSAAVVGVLWSWCRSPGAVALLVAVVTYKMADSLVDPMFQPYLVDRGVDTPTIGLWVGTIGMGSSIAGSLAGGLLASRLAITRALVIAGVCRAIPLLLVFLVIVAGLPAVPWAAATTGVEHFFSGMLTTTMFALMMSRTDRSIGATHYTFLATVEVLGKAPLSFASGAIADAVGYEGSFAIAVTLALLWSAAAPWLLRAAPVAPATSQSPPAA